MEIFCCTVVSQGNWIYAYIKINKIYFRKKLRTRIPIKTIKQVFYFNLDQVLFVWNMNIIQNKNNSYRLMIYQLHCIFIFIEKIIMHTCIFFPLKCTEFITKYTDFTQHWSQFKGSKIVKTFMICELMQLQKLRLRDRFSLWGSRWLPDRVSLEDLFRIPYDRINPC